MMQNTEPKHYLWAVGEGIKTCRPGSLIAGRYRLIRDQILLDTQPDLIPESPEELPAFVGAYLRLFPHRLHVPQVYGMISRHTSKLSTDLWLLEFGSISRKGETLLPELTSVWKKTPRMRQLNWLWQIAQLWAPFKAQDVAATLLNPKLVRVDGSLVRILELEFEGKKVTLRNLGQVWQQWVDDAHPSLTSFLKQLSQQLIAGEIHRSDVLINQLDKALAICGKSHQRIVHITSATDTGPTRSHNEDACYPVSETVLVKPPGMEAFAIVCDGIGGQEAGEVASELAIKTLKEQIEKMPLHQANWDPSSLKTKLERATCTANDVIAQRNDIEHRQGRQRMGTTLVMGLAHIHEIYITHIGDSRAYWITRQGCYPVTVDDDVASREVHLGYSLYRYALQQVAAGALVQALGITSSSVLHPTVQRIPIDDDCIFLFCSDGLSDRDRIEQCWEQEILPLLTGEEDLVSVRDRLISIANTRNGHDNVTIALMYFQVTEKEEGSETELILSPVEPSQNRTIDEPEFSDTGDSQSGFNTTLVSGVSSSESSPTVFLKIVLLLIIGGLLAIFFVPPLISQIQRWLKPNPPSPPQISPTIPSSSPTIIPPVSSYSAPTPFPFKPASLITIQRGTAEQPKGLILYEQDKLTPKGLIPLRSVVQVLKVQRSPTVSWLYIKSCPPRITSNVDKTNASPKSETNLIGWMKVPKDPSSLQPKMPNSFPPIPCNSSPITP